MHQIHFLLGVRPRRRWGSLQCPPDPCLYLRGLFLRGWRETGDGEEKAKEKKGRGGGRNLVHPKILVWRFLACDLSFVTQFKYLGHLIEDTLYDDSDINRELRCLFTRANVLNRRFWRCSVDVKLRLFRTFCLCFYDLSLWKYYKVGTMNSLR